MPRKDVYRGPRWRKRRLLEVPTWPHDTEYMIHEALRLVRPQGGE